MIINGGSRRNGTFFAKHLGNAQENERVTLCEIRNLAAETIAEAFQEMEAIAMGTRCENYFYHANINPLSKETLTQRQWNRAVDLLEAKLCLTGSCPLHRRASEEGPCASARGLAAHRRKQNARGGDDRRLREAPGNCS
jgi:hypothetical protein